MDAVVVGSGPNGLVAANLLADAGWTVLVLEAQPEPGGAVRTAELTGPGAASDLFSGFYPLTLASPVMTALDLGAHGLEWRHAQVALAHPVEGGRAAAVHGSPEATAASLESFAPGDGQSWLDLYRRWEQLGPRLLEAMCRPFPPLAAGSRLAWARRRELAELARFALLPARTLARETFGGDGGRLLVVGNTLHTDLSPEQASGGLFGWLLASLAQQVGFPCPRGGPGAITAALVARLRARGGRLACSCRVSSVVVGHQRARGVVTEDGQVVTADRAVIADVSAPALYLHLLAPRHVPARLRSRLADFEPDHAVVKVDWALSAPIPWAATDATRAAVVHVGPTLDAMSTHALQVASGSLPARPYLVVGQTTVVEPSRAPGGTHLAWGYTHVPHRVEGDALGVLQGRWPADGEAFADRMEAEIERLAPGFRSLIRARHLLTPPDMVRLDANLADGSVNSGTAQLHQQGPLRPVPGLGRPETPVRGLYLGSASAHPGGGVHGACGANAARVALWHDRLRPRWPGPAAESRG